MILEQISLSNFECYYGEHEKNKFAFDRGINLIIGDNGGGKSKLFDAFYWVLHDQIFNTDERVFVPTRIYKEGLLSDKAKKECKIGDPVVAEVAIRVIDSLGTQYRVTRTYKSTRISERDWQGDSESILLIYKFKAPRWQLESSDKHKSILNRIIPGHLKPYMWFQGEQVDGLMDFKTSSSLTQAITMLSDISKYDDLIEVADAGKTKSEKSYSSEIRNRSKNKAESERIAEKIESLEKKIKQLELDKEDFAKERNFAQVQFDNLINQIDDAKSKSELKQERERLTESLTISSDELDRELSTLNKKLFTDSWILKSAQPHLEDYALSYRRFFESHSEAINKRNEVVVKLPIDIPQPIHVNSMLEDERCFVCGREASKGSDAYAHIQSLLERKTKEPQKIFENDTSKFYEDLYNNSLGYEQLIKKIDKSIASNFEYVEKLRSTIQHESDRIKEIDEQFGELVADDRSEGIVQEFKTHQRKIEENTEKLAHVEKDLEIKRGQLKKEKTAESALSDGRLNPVIAAAQEIWSDIAAISKATRDDVFEKLIAELEGSANSIFQKMTAENASITGRLKLKMLSSDSCVPEIIGKDGSTMVGSNDSNIILIKLALIMAVVTSRARWSQNYSLISDAPTSKMASKYSHGFYRALGENFEQSIVMTYDFLTESERSNLASFRVGKVYRIYANYPGGDREDRTDLDIEISEVSL